MPPFSMPPMPDVQSGMSTGSGSAFPAELQSVAPAPEAGDPHEVLLQRIQDLNNSANQLQTQITMNKQIGESEQASVIIRALEILQTLGVNVNDPQSIAKYLMKLEEENPDMAEMAKKTLYGIFGGGHVEENAVPSGAIPPIQGALPPGPESSFPEPQF